jgi:hypothetical protein
MLYRFGGGLLAWGDVLLVPNSFVFDGRGWWRLDDSSYLSYVRDPTSDRVFGVLPSFTLDQPRYASVYTPNVPARDFSWQSQPIGLLPRRRAEIRSCSVVAQGAGSVAVSVTPTDGDVVQAQPNTVPVTLSGPTRVHLPMLVYATEFTVRIVSTGSSGGPAPVVYSVDLEVVEGSNIISQ